MNTKRIFIKLIQSLAIIILLLNFVAIIPAHAVKPEDISTITKSDGDEKLEKSITKIGGSALGVIQTIAVATAFIMLIVIAAKYIMGAPDEKAGLKKQMYVYVIGAMFAFSAAGIIQFIKTFTDSTL